MTKLCPKCNAAKPATAEFWRRDKNRRDGWYPYCKACHNAAARSAYAASPAPKIAKNMAWNRAHRERAAEISREHYTRNKEAQHQARVHDRLDNPAKHRERAAAQYLKRRDYHADYARRWRRVNPDKVRVINHRRRARLNASAGAHTAEDIARIYADQGGRCAYCGRDLHGRYHVDHRTPLARGGGNGPENLACACARCNSRKFTKTASEFIALLAVESNPKYIPPRRFVMQEEEAA